MTERTKTLAAVLFVLAAFVVLFASISSSTAGNGDTGLQMRSAAEAPQASDFTLPEAASGRSVTLSSLRGKPAVFDFWATWCGPCREELPHLEKVAQKYAGRVTFYGINSNDSLPKIREFALKNKMNFPTLGDTTSQVANQYHVNAIPRLIVVDSQGRVRIDTEGVDPRINFEKALSKNLDTILKE